MSTVHDITINALCDSKLERDMSWQSQLPKYIDDIRLRRSTIKGIKDILGDNSASMSAIDAINRINAEDYKSLILQHISEARTHFDSFIESRMRIPKDITSSIEEVHVRKLKRKLVKQSKGFEKRFAKFAGNHRKKVIAKFKKLHSHILLDTVDKYVKVSNTLCANIEAVCMEYHDAIIGKH
jgi:hypothetical protein